MYIHICHVRTHIQAIVKTGNKVEKVKLSKTVVSGPDTLDKERAALTRPKTDRTLIANQVCVNMYGCERVSVCVCEWKGGCMCVCVLCVCVCGPDPLD